ncbi:MAG: RCC1 domain-containing protein, partial [Verrucomicrobiota bacterium]
MKNQKHFLTLLLILGACAGTSATHAAIADAVVAWGDNSYGQATVPVAAKSGVRAIAAGFAHTVALKNDGSVVAWGAHGNGQATVPVTAQSGVTAIAAGPVHIAALLGTAVSLQARR